MTTLHSSPKPSLHLALSPAQHAHQQQQPTPPNSSRRVASWGSATSDTYHAIHALEHESFAGLPSPLDFGHDKREFGFLPSSGSTTSLYGGTGGAGGGGGTGGYGGSQGVSDWQASWNGGKSVGGRSSVFEELRDTSVNEFGPIAGNGGGGWLDYDGTGGTNTPTRCPSTSGKGGRSDDGRKEPQRSKTLSFFDSIGGSSERSGALSPPPNPPSRNNSLTASTRSARQEASSSSSAAASSNGTSNITSAGSWGAFPSLSASPVPPPSLAPPPAPTTAFDNLRASVASSSGGSWLDDAAGEAGGKLWARGRGGSIGSVGGRRESPSRFDAASPLPPPPPPPSSMAHDIPAWNAVVTSDAVNALRPRLASLNTSYLPSDSPASLTSTTSSPSLQPLTSLPTAIEAPLSISTPAARSARFLHLASSHSRNGSASSSSSLPSGAQANLDLPPPVPSSQREGGKKTSSSSTATASTSTTLSPSDPDLNAEASEADLPPLPQPGDRLGEYTVERILGKGAFSRVALATRRRVSPTRRRGDALRTKGSEGVQEREEEREVEEEKVALKLVARSACEGNERMRISVLREVEVLKNISHPSLVSLSSTFTTPLYTALALDFCAGGELFDFLADWHNQISERMARRMFAELVGAVGWMHEIGLVHRDIKLENILLTSRPFPSPSNYTSDPASLLPSSCPFIKLTDFGLSRFINPSSPFLSTRCGSEAYAAPELIMGKKYDGRATDAWALGVVLYAIITGVMPFVEATEGGARARRSYLLKIAKADYRWPGERAVGRSRVLSTASATSATGLSSISSTPSTSPTKPSYTYSSTSHTRTPSSSSALSAALLSPSSPPPPPHSSRLITPPVQSLVARLLVRDPAKRASVASLGAEEWLLRGVEEDEGTRRGVEVRGVMRRRSERGREREKEAKEREKAGGVGTEGPWGVERRGSELLQTEYS